ncbi:hypothetical protein BU15DRAFT_32312, partial [Melanogaster broomeanus]
LTDRDRDNLRAFSLRLKTNMSRADFTELRTAFAHKLALDSEYLVEKRLGVLSDIVPTKIDCCVNSCMAFTGPHVHEEQCLYCGESRFDKDHPRQCRRHFSYLPLSSQLQGLFHDPSTVRKLRYRYQYISERDTISDVFDASIYRDLCQHRVVVDGVAQPYHYFSGKNDIAFALATDGYLLFGRQRK